VQAQTVILNLFRIITAASAHTEDVDLKSWCAALEVGLPSSQVLLCGSSACWPIVGKVFSEVLRVKNAAVPNASTWVGVMRNICTQMVHTISSMLGAVLLAWCMLNDVLAGIVRHRFTLWMRSLLQQGTWLA
jgi:hypothetical protein